MTSLTVLSILETSPPSLLLHINLGKPPLLLLHIDSEKPPLLLLHISSEKPPPLLLRDPIEIKIPLKLGQEFRIVENRMVCFPILRRVVFTRLPQTPRVALGADFVKAGVDWADPNALWADRFLALRAAVEGADVAPRTYPLRDRTCKLGCCGALFGAFLSHGGL